MKSSNPIWKQSLAQDAATSTFWGEIHQSLNAVIFVKHNEKLYWKSRGWWISAPNIKVTAVKKTSVFKISRFTPKFQFQVEILPFQIQYQGFQNSIF